MTHWTDIYQLVSDDRDYWKRKHDELVLSVIAEVEGMRAFGAEVVFTVDFPYAAEGFKEEAQEWAREELKRMREE